MTTEVTPSTANRLSQGSIWRKWDLQACTNHYCNYRGPTLTPEQVARLHELTGIARDRINSEHRDLTDQEFATLYVEYLTHFTDLAVVAITNHNTGKGIQVILDYLQERAKNDTNPRYRELHVFPGVEISANDKCHILIVFNPATRNRNKHEYDQTGQATRELTWEGYIERFLDAIGVPARRFDHRKPASSSTHSTCQILDLHDEWDFLPIFPHIDQSGGWNKELPESLRKESFRHPIFGIVDVATIGGNTDLLNIP